MSPFPLRAPRALVLGLLLVGSPLRPAFAADDFQRYLGAAVQLYENLEYERALAQVQRARTVARGVEQDVALGLHEGIFLAEMGRWNEARTSFETALLLDPAAKLPLSVSPKVESQFELISQSVNAAIARRKQSANPDTAASTATTDVKPTDAKPGSASPMATAKTPEQKPVGIAKTPEQKPVAAAKTPEQKPVAAAKAPEQKPVVASDRPEQARPGRLTPLERSPGLTPKMHKSPSRAPVIPLLLLGTAAVAGSVGVYYAASPGTSSEMSQNKATAGMMFGTAGVALAGAVVSWFIIEADTSDKPVARPSGP